MSPIARKVIQLLGRSKQPMTMRQILTRIQTRNPNWKSAAICNAVHNNSNPYFMKHPSIKKVEVEGKFYFSLEAK